MKFKLWVSVFILFIFNSKILSVIIYDDPIKAICIAPIVDLLSDSVKEINPFQSVESQYATIPYSPELEDLSCLRVFQAIFNETVDILEETDEEIKVQINTVFFKIDRRNFQKNAYWALKKNFKKIDELKNANFNLDLLPESIDCNTVDFNKKPNQKIITLKLPFHDCITNNIYSAGTRFVYKEKIDQYYVVFIYDNNINKIVETKITETICIDFKNISFAKKVENFISLLKLWANLPKKFIPYVWGGSSMQHLYVHNNFKLIHGYDIDGNRANFYTRKDQSENPCSGFDCSTLIARATQMCQIPYFFKDSITILKHLKPLTEDDTIEAGDLIWFPGHVIVVSDIKNNLIIEARGYKSGHGKVHEIPISKMFKDIKNFNDLLDYHLNNRQLLLINKAGNVSARLDNFKILKLKSLLNWV